MCSVKTIVGTDPCSDCRATTRWISDGWPLGPVSYTHLDVYKRQASLDNLLVWLMWLNNGSYENAVKTVNNTVFGKPSDKFLAAEIRRVPPEAVVHSCLLYTSRCV